MSARDPRSEVIAKALKDPAFKAELLKNPAAAIEKAAGVKIPAGVTVKVVEDSATTVHLVLPAAASKGALSDSDLGKVAGGYQVPTYVPCYDANTGMTYRAC